jgi:hypothetical protein
MQEEEKWYRMKEEAVVNRKREEEGSVARMECVEKYNQVHTCAIQVSRHIGHVRAEE